MRRTPSVVPDTPCEAYLVLDDFGGNIGKAGRETIEANTTRDALVRDLLEGLYVCPTRIVAFNIGEGWCRDATIDIACELSDICVNMDQVPDTSGHHHRLTGAHLDLLMAVLELQHDADPPG